MDRTDHRHSPRALEITIHAPDDLAPARREIRAWLRERLSDAHIDEILLASGEALANALEHGHTPVVLSMRWTDDILHVDITDGGAWRVSAGATSRGLGIPIMTALSDSLALDTTHGTTVRLTRTFGS